MNEMPMKGNLKDARLPRLLAYLNRNRETGTLAVKTPAFTKSVYIIKGDAVFASSTYEDDRLGEMLIKAGKITMEQYDRSVQLLKKTGKRQGAILVELGYLTPKDLFWGVKYQVREIIYSLFLLEDAEYEFVKGKIPEHEVITLKMSMGNLIYEGVNRIDNWTRIRKEMPGVGTALRLSRDPAALFQDIELGPQDKKMLSLIDSRKTVKELIDNAWTGSFEGMKILYALWSIGVIEESKAMPKKVLDTKETLPLEDILKPVSEDEHAFLKKVDELYANIGMLSPSQLLEVDSSADQGTIRKKYYKLTKEFHPDRYFESADALLKDKLTAIFDALRRAYVTLSGKEEEEIRREKAVPSPNGGSHFKNGVEAFKKKYFAEAAGHFRAATETEPRNVKYWSYLSLALSKSPDMLKDAEKALIEAIRLQPDNADHYVNLGLIYLRQRMKKKAHRNFAKALSLDPRNTKARKGLEKTAG